VAVTLQKKLELAGDLAKVQPLLQRLHLVEEPKRRFGGRVILLSGVIAVIALALAAVAVRRRRVLAVAVLAEEGDSLLSDFPAEDGPPAEDALPAEDATATTE
jgi:hypothetical protein